MISGIMQRVNLCAILIASIVDGMHVRRVFYKLSQNQINIEFINQISQHESKDIILCVDRKNMYTSLGLLKEIQTTIKAKNILSLSNVGILSVFPHKERAMIFSALIQTLSSANIPIIAMGSSISSLSCVVKEEMVPDALRMLSKKFGLSS